jgi:hypothetical protein
VPQDNIPKIPGDAMGMVGGPLFAALLDGLVGAKAITKDQARDIVVSSAAILIL